MATKFGGFVRTKTYDEAMANSVTDGKIYFPIDRDCIVENGTAHDFSGAYGLFLEDTYSYGVFKDMAQSSPTCTRIGSTTLHKTLPVQSQMELVLLDDSGNETQALTYEDGDEVYGDPDSAVMVRIPAHYRKVSQAGTLFEARLSMYPLPGYTLVPRMYVSAFEAVMERSTGRLCSFVPECYPGLPDMDEDAQAAWLANYRGGTNDSAWDGTYRTLIGKPVTNLSLTSFRAAARLRNASDTSWNCYTYDVHKALYWLFVTEYATLNSQLAFNASPTSEGYRQGGLGPGVTTVSSTLWSNYNRYSPLVPAGVTRGGEDSGLFLTNAVSYEIPAESGTFATVSVPKYRGVENPFGHIFKWTDGCKSLVQSEAAGGLSEFYTCSDPAAFTSNGTEGYGLRGFLPRKDGYVSRMMLGRGGDVMPIEVNGGSTTYFCDYFYTFIPSNDVSERGVLFGGIASYGSYAGLACAYSSHAPSFACAYFGSRLCFIPG